MEEWLKEFEPSVLCFKAILYYVSCSYILTDTAKLLELKNFYMVFVEVNNLETEFLETIEEFISTKETVPDYLIDLKAFVEVNIL